DEPTAHDVTSNDRVVRGDRTADEQGGGKFLAVTTDRPAPARGMPVSSARAVPEKVSGHTVRSPTVVRVGSIHAGHPCSRSLAIRLESPSVSSRHVDRGDPTARGWLAGSPRERDRAGRRSPDRL